MNNLNLRQLEIFVTIVESGSFTEAANRLYLAQSTVSSHIKTLEDALHTVLFNREAKKCLTLTDNGKRVYNFAKEIVRKCSDLESDLEKEFKNELIIGASTVPSYELVPRLVAKFMEEHPNCRVTIKGGNSERIQQMLVDQSIHIGFIGTADNRQALSYECVSKDHLILITPNNEHFRAFKESGAYGKQLLTEPFIFRESDSATQKYAYNYLTSMGESRELNVVAYASNTDTIMSLVERGVGVTILSQVVAKEKIKAGKVLAFDLDEVPLKRNIYMARLKKGYVNQLANDFASMTTTVPPTTILVF